MFKHFTIKHLLNINKMFKDQMFKDKCLMYPFDTLKLFLH
jgi:hypothetical protein